GTWEYNTALFEPATIARMSGHFRMLLAAIIDDADRAISQLPLLTEAERRQILHDWNATRTDYAAADGIHQLFEAQVERTPDALAIIYEDHHLTYAQLNRRANQLAYYLQAQGVGPETLVGICLDRSVEMVVSLLGILKAGGAYVPLDPTYPAERLAFMVADARITHVISHSAIADPTPDLTRSAQQATIYIDTVADHLSALPKDNPAPPTAPANLAYVIYTSGSTGRPKAVAVPHRGLLNVVAAQKSRFALTPADRVLQFASLNFDASLFEMVMAWGVGAPLCLASRERLWPGPALSQFLAEQQITMVTLPPSALAVMPPVELPALQQITVAGEACPADLVKAWSTGRAFFNLYGPTEATIWATAARCRPDQPKPPIGRPIMNTRTIILNEALQPVPIGVVGELYIGGIGLSRGYLNRPGLTAERFIPDPLSRKAGERLYKTGDLARYRPDGNIEFMGRIDHQVKLRGFRIELGEIEAVLNQHPAVRHSAVIVRATEAKDQELLAYLVPTAEQAAPGLEPAEAEPGITPSPNPSLVSTVRHVLQQKLPDYMIPATFVVLEALPLTSSGKIDRRALPAPEPASLAVANTLSPRDPLEQQLMLLWQQELKRPAVGIRDNFFEIGGHSLLAVRLMARIQQHFDRHLPLAALFEQPTIETLAALLRQAPGPDLWSPLVTIQPLGDKPPFFCVPGAGSNPLYLYPLARYLGPDQPFYGFQAQGLDGVTAPFETIEAMAAHYVAAMQMVQPEGPYTLGGHSLGGMVAFEMAQQLLHQGQTVARLAILDALPFAEGDVETATWDETQWLISFANNVEKLLGQELRITAKRLRALTLEEQYHAFKQRLEQAGVLPAGMDIKQVRGQIRVFKANHQAAASHTRRDVIPLPVTLICPDAEPDSDHEATIQAWAALGSVDFHEVPGTHITMMAEPQVRLLAATLAGCLPTKR
ncbi:MAG: amino acid adenylation domain-containing protein, partial [Anaerolineae bacterium]|nr:amino acid adenylation domain-containing protein [Anaerolineae bacterium]